MRLYLVRHGEAKSEVEDPECSLTVRGEEETMKISDAAKRLGLRLSKIYHSGKRRCLWRRSGKSSPVSIQRYLVPGKERARKMGSRLVSQTGNGLRGGF